jgi:tRNA threonylcarbamoyl adenosine modification protein YjeE
LTESQVLLSLEIADAEAMDALGLALANNFQAGDLVLLIGPLGAGKTTLARGIGKGLEVEGNVSSPTFVIARTHQRNGAPLVHVDAYRLASAFELDDLDIPFASSIVLVEWGKGLTEGIADNWLEIEIGRDHTGETEDRTVEITGYGPRWQQVTL